MPDKSIKEHLKGIVESIRMIIVYKLCSLILDIAPNTPEGRAFVHAIGVTAQKGIEEVQGGTNSS